METTAPESLQHNTRVMESDSSHFGSALAKFENKCRKNKEPTGSMAHSNHSQSHESSQKIPKDTRDKQIHRTRYIRRNSVECMHFVPEYSTKDNKTINHFNSNESLHHVPEPEYIGKDNKTMHHFNSNEAMHYVPDYSTKDNKTIHPFKNNEARTSSPTHSTGSSTHSTESTGYTNHSLVNRSFHSERAEEDGDALRRSLHRDRGLGYAGESLSIATARNKIENQVEVNDYVSERDKYANHSLTNRSFHSERAEEDGDALRRSLHRDRGLGYTGESPSIATARNKIENQVKLNDYVNERDSPRGKSKSTKKVKKVKKPDKQYDRISLPVKLNPQNASYEPYEKPAPYRPHRDKETDSSRPAKPKKEKERSKKDRSKKDESKKEKAKKTRKEKKTKQ